MNNYRIKSPHRVALLKTLWFNFRYFPFQQACKLPVILAKGVHVRYCHKGFCEIRGKVHKGILRIGFGDRMGHVGPKCVLLIEGKIVLVGDGAHVIGPGTHLAIWKNAVLTLGNNFTSSIRNKISCSCAITVGDDNMWSFDNVIMDTDAHQICDENGRIMNYNKPIVFGNHVWLGCHSIVMKGSEVADGCMIASGSKISGKYTEPNCIITTGKKIIKQNIHWKRDRAKSQDMDVL